MTDTIQTAVIGVTGYAGAELARLLLRHPRLKNTPPVFAGRQIREQTPKTRRAAVVCRWPKFIPNSGTTTARKA